MNETSENPKHLERNINSSIMKNAKDNLSCSWISIIEEQASPTSELTKYYDQDINYQKDAHKKNVIDKRSIWIHFALISLKIRVHLEKNVVFRSENLSTEYADFRTCKDVWRRRYDCSCFFFR